MEDQNVWNCGGWRCGGMVLVRQVNGNVGSRGGEIKVKAPRRAEQDERLKK
jgi:hypothetical protein